MELPLALVILCMVVPGIIYSQDDGCVSYDAKPYSSFNTWNLFVLYPRKNPDMLITNVEIVRRDFYRCKMTQNGVEIVFYGHNGTHYWVEKGCAGDFRITECPEHKFNMAAALESSVISAVTA
ncbi:uncharacterized protein LOC121382566 isoform X2 [Gigantopelta aegis]|uniref:uncharacterized protein LOC121382566 isoform X2 n=1 Tax=Gigantopelta aegis TaxID=1735272 RepID=UPI001B889255|nr:uncharacterized protein LOC121382566 isoform X2 [Gigantopelta aegis]